MGFRALNLYSNYATDSARSPVSAWFIVAIYRFNAIPIRNPFCKKRKMEGEKEGGMDRGREGVTDADRRRLSECLNVTFETSKLTPYNTPSPK